MSDSQNVAINWFHATGLFLYPMKTSEKEKFSDFLFLFAEYRGKPVAWNGLK